MKMISNNGTKAHVYCSGKYYLISDNGKETLIFPSNSKGEIIDYTEVGGARDRTLTEVLGDFYSFLHPTF